jgi:hypothetical protein
MGVEIANHYRDHHAAREIALSLEEVVVRGMDEQLNKSNFIGIQFDSSTDSSSKEQLALPVKYVKEDGTLIETFYKLFTLESKKANDIYNILHNFLEKKKLLEKISAIGTDGEITLASKINGVCGKFKKNNQEMIFVHCISHRLALGTKVIVEDLMKFKALNNLVHSLCAFFHRSPKKMEILSKEEEAANMEELKMLLPSDIRWLSNYAAIKRILDIYVPLVNALQNASEEYSVAAGLLFRMTNFKIIGLLHGFADVLYHLNNACLIFQRKGLNIKSFQSTIDVLVKTSMRRFFYQQFLDKFSY